MSSSLCFLWPVVYLAIHLLFYRHIEILFSSVAHLCLILWPHESQRARPPCPSQTPGVYSNSCPSSQWCHPAISFSVVPFSSCSCYLILAYTVVRICVFCSCQDGIQHLLGKVYCVVKILLKIYVLLVVSLYILFIYFEAMLIDAWQFRIIVSPGEWKPCIVMNYLSLYTSRIVKLSLYSLTLICLFQLCFD